MNAKNMARNPISLVDGTASDATEQTAQDPQELCCLKVYVKQLEIEELPLACFSVSYEINFKPMRQEGSSVE